MSFFYDREGLLNLFDSIYDVDPQVKIVRYSLNLEDGRIFNLFLSPFDARVSVTLLNKDRESWIFDIGVRDVSYISFDSNSIEVYKDKHKKVAALTVNLSPYPSVQCYAF